MPGVSKKELIAIRGDNSAEEKLLAVIENDRLTTTNNPLIPQPLNKDDEQPDRKINAGKDVEAIVNALFKHYINNGDNVGL